MFRPLICLALWLRLWLFVVVGLLPVRAAEPHPSLPKPVIPDCLGVNIHFTDPKPGELEMLAAAGFKWVRMDFSWGSTERKKGEYDFAAYDRLAGALDRLKIRAVFSLDYGNPLYADSGDKSPFTSRARTPEFSAAFGKWAVAAVQHFKGRGYLWEMWNEPNGGNWTSPDKTNDYIALAKSAGEALRRAGLIGLKGEAFIGPATSTIDLPYLEACFKAGLLDYWDAVSVHPYRESAPETVEDDYRSVRLLIRKYAPKDKVIPVISGEWGYSSAWPGMGMDEATRAEQQGRFLPRQLLTNIANDVALSIWYDWRDDGTDPKKGEHHFGLVANEYHPGRQFVYDPKPAYAAMKMLHEQLGGFTFNKRLAFNDPQSAREHVLLFQSNRDIRVAMWGSGEEIEIPASSGKATIISRNGRETVEIAKGEVGLKYQPTAEVAILRFPQLNFLLENAASVTRLPLEMVFEMPGISPEFQLGLTNYARTPVVATVEQKILTSGPPILCPKSRLKQRVNTAASFASRLAAESWQRSIEGADSLAIGVNLAFGPKASVDAEIVQATRLIPANPLTITRLPDVENDVVLKIENPSGQPWIGTLTLFAQDWSSASSPGWSTKNPPGWAPARKARDFLASAPLELKKGVLVQVMHIVLPARLASRWWRGINGVSLHNGSDFGADFPLADSAPVLLDLPNVQVDVDGDPKVAVKKSRQIEDPPGGPVADNIPSIRVNYDFAAGWKCLRVVNPTWPPPGEKDLLQRPRSMSLWIYGDGKGCVARMRFIDSTEQFFQSDGPRIDWIGWRQVTFPMQTSEHRLTYGGGTDDGQIHYPIELDSVLVIDNDSRKPQEGKIYLAAPTLNF